MPNRRVPASAKITFPLMAVQAHGHYVGLIWDRAPELCALFDSPDRLFGTEGHVLGLLAPGAEGSGRVDGELFPLEPLKLAGSRPVTASATIIGGKAAKRGSGRHAVRRAQGPAAAPGDSEPAGLRPAGRVRLARLANPLGPPLPPRGGRVLRRSSGR